MTERPLAPRGRIARLTLARTDDDLVVEIAVETETAAVHELRFLGATDVRFRSERTDLLERVVLVAEAITDRGWENASWFVKDAEEDVVSFYCRAIVPSPT